MTKIARLTVAENATIDTHRLNEIVHELGENAAVQVIGAALEELALAMNHVLQAVARGDLAQVAEHADRLSRLAWQVGLVTLAGVAVDVGSCAERRELRALTATSARLGRVGNQSLTQIWDRHEGA
ncbi:hypothetical protein [Paracoccus laeviglucosivorans]|uniref:Hpt domain-containing protein n=1 Tax=Paracoccus laeviglucosivorans TaxID=1197861 RepID=A0A521DFV4_9RHOB|nr:hypothetical protein [Paracoccus laeviglucosivorans]SMO70599.1 hypothetical protein SAMN06265221_10811 [Paracoccus laeviglucosivorans]